MDNLQASQDGRTVPSEAIGYLFTDNRALPTAPRGQLRVSPSELLVYLQTVEEDDTGMWCK